ncbi:MAG: chemotaxis protein CheD [Gemmatimonadota bacterium]|nr:chemotaxis protein CheD [Gemmatimonadota bacterium]MDH4351676.1 chemotaxis protein CheD [Gemmatimonadota bacterium]MDH5196219.1 chemotaxis protein CheD [Gemmatimonadota bacterium]
MTDTPLRRAIGLGQWGICREQGELSCLGLGSCIALVLDDREAQVGGIAHIVLPSPSLSRDRSNPVRFADTAVPFLVGEMVRAGAVRGRLTARLVGGASLFAALTTPGTVQIGQRNLLACRAAVDAVGVTVVGEAVGGEIGRSVWFAVDTGIVMVRSVGHALEPL